MRCFLCGCTDRLVYETREVYCKRCDVFTPNNLARLEGLRERARRDLVAQGHTVTFDKLGHVAVVPDDMRFVYLTRN
jgi:hypothetical protein